MRLSVFCILFIGTVANGKICGSGYHFWRPYNGTVPRDAFIAGLDENGQRNLVARVVVPDSYSWAIPVQLKEFSDYVITGWYNSRAVWVKANDFVEVLCTENPEMLNWVTVTRYAEEITGECCIVQGGRGIYGGRTYNAYIGKGISEGKIYIGRIYKEKDWDGLHVMDGGNSTKIKENFQVLTYDCIESSPTKSISEVKVV